MMHWTRTPLEAAYDRVFEVFGITQNLIKVEELPIMVNAEQLRALEELEEVLKGIMKEELEQLEPADLFVEPASWGNSYCPACLLYDYKDNLLLVSALFGELGNRAQVEKLAHTLSAEVSRVTGLIDEVGEDYTKTIFAAKLKYLADKKGLSQKDIASQLLLSQQSVNLWYKGKGYPNIPVLISLAVLLDTSLDFLLRADALEVSLDEDALHKSIGLSAESSKVLKELVKGKRKELTTLNYIIETYSNTADSLLYAITDYFKLLHNSSLHMVSDEILADLDYEVKNSKTIQDARAAVSSYVENQASMDYNALVKGAAYDVDKALLIGIMEVLVKMKGKVEKDIYG